MLFELSELLQSVRYNTDCNYHLYVDLVVGSVSSIGRRRGLKHCELVRAFLSLALSPM
jgi:hypothetical protein